MPSAASTKKKQDADQKIIREYMRAIYADFFRRNYASTPAYPFSYSRRNQWYLYADRPAPWCNAENARKSSKPNKSYVGLDVSNWEFTFIRSWVDPHIAMWTNLVQNAILDHNEQVIAALIESFPNFFHRIIRSSPEYYVSVLELAIDTKQPKIAKLLLAPNGIARVNDPYCFVLSTDVLKLHREFNDPELTELALENYLRVYTNTHTTPDAQESNYIRRFAFFMQLISSDDPILSNLATKYAAKFAITNSEIATYYILPLIPGGRARRDRLNSDFLQALRVFKVKIDADMLYNALIKGKL